MGTVDPVFWLAIAIVFNSALSIFYYLRIGLVMFFEAPETDKPLKSATSLRLAITACALLTVILGITSLGDSVLDIISNAVETFIGN
jgi:NADH:ubiquinone oxidoreductase subunit 2 (subunit N)